MKELVNHILYVVWQDQDARLVSPTHLNLIAYKVFIDAIRFGYLTVEEARSMYDEYFYVWRYGAIIPSVRQKYLVWGSAGILETGEMSIRLTPLNDIIVRLSKTSMFTLVDEITSNDFWQTHEDKLVYGKSDVAYPFDHFITEAFK